MTFVYLVVFGALGVVTRYLIGEWTSPGPGAFPWTTLLINLLGSFLIGVVYVLGFEKGALSHELRIGFMTGFLGGFTTFSTFSLDVLRMFQSGQIGWAALYIAFSLLGIPIAFLGLFLARFL
jgi:fluoride exporter